MKGKERKEFRKNKEWQDFRREIIEDNNHTCMMCGSVKLSGLNCHHLNEKDYTNLDEENFAILCFSCHKSVHRLYKKKGFDLDIYVKQLREILTIMSDNAR